MPYSDEERIRAKRRALYILGERDHSKKELYDKLLKNYPADLCRDTVELMTEFGYIDEEKYAKKLYSHYMKKGHGAQKIRYELKHRGISDELIAEIADEYDREDHIEIMKELVLKKYSAKLDFSDRSSVGKVTAALARRGYNYDDIKTVLGRIKSEGLLDDEEDE